jgi:signal transduction histidine kinase
MTSGGKITISVSLAGNDVITRVTDEGPGIPQELLKRVGEPFFTTKEKGTGLGLMVSYSIIENHKGSVEVTSNVNKGTTFSVKLPSLIKLSS